MAVSTIKPIAIKRLVVNNVERVFFMVDWRVREQRVSDQAQAFGSVQ